MKPHRRPYFRITFRFDRALITPLSDELVATHHHDTTTDTRENLGIIINELLANAEHSGGEQRVQLTAYDRDGSVLLNATYLDSDGYDPAATLGREENPSGEEEILTTHGHGLLMIKAYSACHQHRRRGRQLRVTIPLDYGLEQTG